MASPLIHSARTTNRLCVERLEERTPSSTTLDLLLSRATLPFDAALFPLADRDSDTTSILLDQPANSLTRAEPSVSFPPTPEVTMRVADAGQPADCPTLPTASADLGLQTVGVAWPVFMDLGAFDSAPATAPKGVEQPDSGGRVGGGAAGAASTYVPGFGPTSASPAPMVAEASSGSPVPIQSASRDAVPDQSPPSRLSQSDAVPRISLTFNGDGYVPVNANRTSQSPWKQEKAGVVIGADGKPTNTFVYTEAQGLPAVRDFDVSPMRDLSGWNGTLPLPADSGVHIADPELVQVTLTVHSLSRRPAALTIDVEYADANKGGRVALWKDNKKEEAITTGWPAYDISQPGDTTFFVEGTRISLTERDIKIKATYADPNRPIDPEASLTEGFLTVTPVVKKFAVGVKDPAQTTFYKDAFGGIRGLNSGEQSGDDQDPNTLTEAIWFDASINRTSAPGSGKFLQIVTSLTNGTLPSGVAAGYSDSSTPSRHFKHALLPGDIFPINDASDSKSKDIFPFYTPQTQIASGTTQTFRTQDSPFLKTDFAPAVATRIDVSIDFRMYLVFLFTDGTIYSLGRVDWGVKFLAGMNGQNLTIDPSSVTTSKAPVVPYHADPERVTGRTYNDSNHIEII